MKDTENRKERSERRGVRLDILAILVILLVSIGLLIQQSGRSAGFQTEYLNLDGGGDDGVAMGPLVDGVILEERFYADISKLTGIRVRTVTWMRNYPADNKLTVEVLDNNTGELLSSSEVNLSDLPDNYLAEIDIPDTSLTKGMWYLLRFSSNAQKEEESISIMSSGETVNMEKAFAVVDGQEQNYTLDVVLYGE